MELRFQLYVLTNPAFKLTLMTRIQIVIAGVINGHVACKYIYVWLFRGVNHMQERSLLSIGSCIAIALAVWIIAWIIAESIPIFNNLLGLIASFHPLVRSIIVCTLRREAYSSEPL